MIKNTKEKLKEFDKNYDKLLGKIKNKTYPKIIMISNQKDIQNKLSSFLKTKVRLRLELSGIDLYFEGRLQEIIVGDVYEISQGSLRQRGGPFNTIIFKKQNISTIAINNDKIIIYLKYKNK